MSGPALAALSLLLPHSALSTEDAVLTLALAVPGVAAVVVDRLLCRAPRRRVRRRARGPR